MAAPTDREVRRLFGEASNALMHLAACHALKGNEEAKRHALDLALFAFMKEHQEEALGSNDWEQFEDLEGKLFP